MKELFRSVARQMSERLAGISRQFSHSGMKGNSNEEVIREFLRTYLPRKYSVGQGKIVDFGGQESKQADIILYDRNTDTIVYR